MLSKVYVRSSTGQQVRLDAVATVTLGPGPVSVARQSQLPAVTITFNLAPGYTLGEAVGAMRELEREVQDAAAPSPASSPAPRRCSRTRSATSRC